MEITKVTRKGQVTIPEAIRERYGIKVGDHLVVFAGEDAVILKKMEIPSWEELYEIGKRAALTRKITAQQVLKACKEVRRRLWKERHA
ncbi:MAG: AbrB/MazE/SpoVT family DNA-binding domain-containing protein [Candidatus Bathyarchaeia archaeon]